MAVASGIAQGFWGLFERHLSPLSDKDLFRVCYERFGNWAHGTAICGALIADVIHPLGRYTLWIALASVAVAAIALVGLAFHKIREDRAITALIFAIVMAAISGGMCILQVCVDGEGAEDNGVLAHFVPEVKDFQKALRIHVENIQKDVVDIKLGQQKQDVKLDEIAEQYRDLAKQISQRKSVPLPALLKILNRLGESKIADNPKEIEKKLDEKANEYLALQEQLTKIANNDPQVANLRKEAGTDLAAADFESARAKLRAAADIDRAAIAEFEVRANSRANSVVVTLQESARLAKLNLRYKNAADDLGEAATVILRFDRRASARLRFEQGLALNAQGDEFGDNAALASSIDIYRETLTLVSRDDEPQDWASTQNNLGVALKMLGERESGAKRLEDALTAFRAAQEVRSPERTPVEWASTQSNIGNVLQALSDRESGTARLMEAIKVYRSALEVQTRERTPLDWAGTQNNLGTALWRLGSRDSGISHFQESAVALRLALEVWTRETVPLSWAMTQNNLGIDLAALGERANNAAQMQEAVTAYRNALQEFSRERVPLQWAATQNNLGEALRVLGESENDTARLEESISTSRMVLQEWTRERVPLAWAGTQNNIGNALYSLGVRENSAERLKEAIEAYNLALLEWTRERTPIQWSLAQQNLGNTIYKLGIRENDTKLLRDAIAAYRLALLERTREISLLKWGTTKFNLGEALLAVAERDGAISILEEAVEAYRSASEGFKEMNEDRSVEVVTRALTRAEVALADRLAKSK